MGSAKKSKDRPWYFVFNERKCRSIKYCQENNWIVNENAGTKWKVEKVSTTSHFSRHICSSCLRGNCSCGFCKKIQDRPYKVIVHEDRPWNLDVDKKKSRWIKILQWKVNRKL